MSSFEETTSLRSSVPNVDDGQVASSALEFGHFAISGPGFHIDGWGAGPFMLGKWRFEDSDRFGPALVNRNGELKANPYPAEKHPFWTGYSRWREGGRRMADDGVTCLWDPPKPTLFRRVKGRREVVEFGDEGGGYREVTDANPHAEGKSPLEGDLNPENPVQQGGQSHDQ